MNHSIGNNNPLNAIDLIIDLIPSISCQSYSNDDIDD